MARNPRKVTTKVDMIHSRLREAILNGVYKAGDRLVLRQLAIEFAVSEIPVREAIKLLEAQGLVTSTPFAGATVTELRVEDIEQIYPIRACLEAFATRLATANMTDQRLAELEAKQEEIRAATLSGQLSELGVLNQEFNYLIHSLCGNQRLLDLIDQLKQMTNRTRALFVLVPERVQASYEEHQAILEALRARDAARAEQLVRQHKTVAGEALMRKLRAANTEKEVSPNG